MADPKQVADGFELSPGIAQGEDRPEGALADRAAVGGRGEVEDDLLRLAGKREEVEELRDPRPGDAHPGRQGRLGQVRIGVEFGAEPSGLPEQDLDGGELQDMEELRDPGSGDAPPGREGRLGQGRVGIELGAEPSGLLEQDLDGRWAEGPGALGVEGLGILLAQKGLAAVGAAPDAERKDVLEARSALISVGFGEPDILSSSRVADAEHLIDESTTNHDATCPGRRVDPGSVRPVLRHDSGGSYVYTGRSDGESIHSGRTGLATMGPNAKPSARGLNSVRKWMELMGTGDIDGAMNLLAPALGPWESDTREMVLKQLRMFVEPVGDMDPTSPDLPRDWVERALKPTSPPLTPPSRMREPTEHIDFWVVDAEADSDDPNWFGVDHSLPIDGEWSELFAVFCGTIHGDAVVLVLEYMKS